MEDHELVIKTSNVYVYNLKAISAKYKAGRIALEHIPINDTAYFTQLFAIIPIQDAKPACNHELEQDETDELGSTLSKSTRRNV